MCRQSGHPVFEVPPIARSERGWRQRRHRVAARVSSNGAAQLNLRPIQRLAKGGLSLPSSRSRENPQRLGLTVVHDHEHRSVQRRPLTQHADGDHPSNLGRSDKTSRPHLRRAPHEKLGSTAERPWLPARSLSSSMAVRSSSTLVIAEVGVNHNGDVDLAHRLIEASAAAGANVVKFQTFDPQLVVSASGRTAEYQLQSTGQRSQQEMLAGLSLPRSAWVDLADHCRQLDVEFLSTAFDWQSLEMLLEIGLRRIKIPSGEIDNVRFIARASDLGLPLVISTGMSDWDDVDLAVASSTNAPEVTLLHCVSLYPTPPEATNLSVIPAMRDRYHLPTGWSDHTLGVQAAVMAVTSGCDRYREAHHARPVHARA